jgi:hypothetical protein
MFQEKLTTKPICLNCRAQNDGATGASNEDSAPVEGDYAICVYCKSLQKFGPGCETFLPLTKEEWEEISQDADFMEMLQRAGGVISALQEHEKGWG